MSENQKVIKNKRKNTKISKYQNHRKKVNFCPLKTWIFLFLKTACQNLVGNVKCQHGTLNYHTKLFAAEFLNEATRFGESHRGSELVPVESPLPTPVQKGYLFSYSFICLFIIYLFIYFLIVFSFLLVFSVRWWETKHPMRMTLYEITSRSTSNSFCKNFLHIWKRVVVLTFLAFILVSYKRFGHSCFLCRYLKQVGRHKRILKG